MGLVAGAAGAYGKVSPKHSKTPPTWSPTDLPEIIYCFSKSIPGQASPSSLFSISTGAITGTFLYIGTDGGFSGFSALPFLRFFPFLVLSPVPIPLSVIFFESAGWEGLGSGPVPCPAVMAAIPVSSSIAGCLEKGGLSVFTLPFTGPRKRGACPVSRPSQSCPQPRPRAWAGRPPPGHRRR